MTDDLPPASPGPGATGLGSAGTPSTAGERARRRRTDREIVLFALGILVIAVILAVLPDLAPSGARGLVSERIHSRIIAIQPSNGGQPPTATVQYLEGSRIGEQDTALLEGPSGQLQLPNYAVGDEVIVAIDVQPDNTTTISVVDRWRLPLLAGLAGLFALATIAIAGWRGVRSLVSLGITLVIAIRILIPLLLAGWNPLVLAIGLGSLITLLGFSVTQGLNRAALAAFVGTTSGLAITGVLAAIVTGLAQFTPAQGSEDVVAIAQLGNGVIDLSGLLLAAVIFGGLGVLIDVAISQAATVEELHSVDASMGPRMLYRRAMNVGIAHLGATINTLVFAYLGSALPLLVLFAIQVRGLGFPVNEEAVAVEIVRTLVGSIGILAAVPITTALAAWAVSRAAGERPAGRLRLGRTIRQFRSRGRATGPGSEADGPGQTVAEA